MSITVGICRAMPDHLFPFYDTVGRLRYLHISDLAECRLVLTRPRRKFKSLPHLLFAYEEAWSRMGGNKKTCRIGQVLDREDNHTLAPQLRLHSHFE